MHITWQTLENLSQAVHRDGIGVFRFVIAREVQIRDYVGLLNNEEERRLAAFKSEAASVQFLVSRATLRVLLGRFLQIAPAQIQFKSTESGKLYLPDNQLYFNISHTEGWGMVAISRRHPVGVDVEQHKELHDACRVAQRAFSTEEYERVCNAATEIERLATFYRIWTAKEACVKAVGLGLRADTRSFTTAAAAPTAFMPVRADANSTAPWTQCQTSSLPMPEHWSAALAVQTPDNAPLPEPACYTVRDTIAV